MTRAVRISGREIGVGHPPWIVAEMSGNHNGDRGRALAIIEAAKEAGADAVKLQTYTADTITIDCDRPQFRIKGGPWDGKTLYQLYDWAHTPWDWHEALFARGRELGLTVFSSPFDSTAVDLLETLDAPAYKVASFEIVDLPLIERMAKTGRPLLISTGLASMVEIDAAVAAARQAGCDEIVLLHCVSAYPTPVEDSNILTMPDLAAAFQVPVGLSDHTPGATVPIAATALGANMIEKHITLSRADGGPDSAFSLEPEEFKQVCEGCRTAWEALGTVDYHIKKSEVENEMFRRSIYAVVDIKSDELFTLDNVRSIRPGHGLAPKHLDDILGRRARTDINRGTPLSWDLVS